MDVGRICSLCSFHRLDKVSAKGAEEAVNAGRWNGRAFFEQNLSTLVHDSSLSTSPQ